MSPRLTFAIETASEAAKGTLRHFQAGVLFDVKEDASPVTVADREAERFIRQAIAREYPNDEILGEEEGGSQSDDRWVIDPIDGTKSFLAGVPLFATLLSYEQEGVPILGVCVLPGLDEVIYAERNQGAFCNSKPCRVSFQARIERSIVSCGSVSSMQAAGRLAPYLLLADKVLAARGWTDAYGHMLVATGRIEAMLDPVVKHWDLSAVSIIVQEAGGSFTDFSGKPGIAGEAVSCAPGIRSAVLGAFEQ